MWAALITVGAAVGIMAVGFGLALAMREHARRHPDPAWKPTGYRVR